MIEIENILLPNNTPYNVKEFVGTLLFAQYPTTMIFSDNEGNPVVKEWVDYSVTENINRFFFYKTTKVYLKQFIDGEMSHLDFINSSLESYLIFQDVQHDSILKTFLISLSALPLNYKPSADFLFDYSDGVDIIEIVNYFDLDAIGVKNSVIGLVKNISIKNSTETLYIKLNRGRGVGHGTVNTEIFGKTLGSFDKFYKSIALDFLLGNNRGDISLDAKSHEDKLQYTETVIYDNRIAASYGFLIKPLMPHQTDLFGEETQTEKIAIKAFGLINKSKDTVSLKEEYLLHSVFTINSFTIFLNGIIKAQLNIDLNWFSPFSKNEISNNIDYLNASRIVYDINNLKTTKSTEFRTKGKFRAVNCDTGHYNFDALSEEHHSGYFDKSVKDGIVQINFIQIYEILISRKLVKEVGKKDESIVDTIMSFYFDT